MWKDRFFDANFLDKIMQHQDLHETGERMKKCQEDGSGAKDRLSKFAKLSAGNHVKSGANRMGKDTFEVMKERHLEKEWELKEKMDEARRNWGKASSDASTFLQEKNPVGKMDY